MKMTKLKKKNRRVLRRSCRPPFHGELVDFMSSGPITAAILEKENAVEDFRKLIGSTKPGRSSGRYHPEIIRRVDRRKRHSWKRQHENAAIEGKFLLQQTGTILIACIRRQNAPGFRAFS